MRRRACGGYEAHRLRGLPIPRWLALACLLGVVLLNSGCVMTGPLDWFRNGFKVGPNYCRPPAPAAPEWIDARNPNVQSRHAQYSDWWSVFKDPILNSLIETAYHQNLTLRIVGTRVLEARAGQAIAVGNIFPQSQQATAQYSRVNLSEFMPNNPATLNPLFLGNPAVSLIPGFALPQSFYSDWQTGFNLSWELDFWGRFRRAIESANASFDASVENFDDALVTLLADVAANYVQYRIFQQRIKIARDNVKIQEDILALVEKQYKVGINKVTRLDVEQARTVLEQTRSTIPALEIGLRQANNALCVLLGMPPCDLAAKLGPVVAPGSEPMPNTPLCAAVGIPADLLRRRPDVRSAERQVAAQSAQVGVAEADLYPSLFINGTLGFDAQDIAKLFQSNAFFGTITPNFRWNILNYGRIVNNVHLQQARTQELIAAYQNRVLVAGQEVENGLVGFLRSQEQARSLASSVEAATAATKLGQEQYAAGTIPFNTVFNLETTQVQQQDLLAVAQGNIALGLISVYRALGGGWELRLQDEHGEGPVLDLPDQGPAPAAAETEQLPAPRQDAKEKPAPKEKEK
jgi:NodT family efflux transporter outer membrane factor (OMF) lipoprotein